MQQGCSQRMASQSLTLSALPCSLAPICWPCSPLRLGKPVARRLQALPALLALVTSCIVHTGFHCDQYTDRPGIYTLGHFALRTTK